MSAPTKAQMAALKVFRDEIGEHTAVMMPRGRILCAGEFIKCMPETILGLVGHGLLEFVEPKRLGLTDAGRAALL